MYFYSDTSKLKAKLRQRRVKQKQRFTAATQKYCQQRPEVILADFANSERTMIFPWVSAGDGKSSETTNNLHVHLQSTQFACL